MKETVASSEFQVRDPFVLPVPEERRYYLYGTMLTKEERTIGAYFSIELKHWTGPVVIFRTDGKFWADKDYWAPEVHKYQGKYYMFASFKSDNHCRATQILVSEKPLGPFKPLTDKPITPQEWECLDGTFFVDDAGKPWIVFCHEWLQVSDGEIWALPLTEDLKEAAGRPVLLFKASDALWTKSVSGSDSHTKDMVTDGPFVYRTADGTLLMIWSSFGKNGYAMGIAQSESGKIQGPWKQLAKPLFEADGGHGMLFRDFDGRLICALHKPNVSPNERLNLIPISESGSKLILPNE
ncbi:MAG: glycoside hydrolase family 43 protein [Armatimonadota bacterium]